MPNNTGLNKFDIAQAVVGIVTVGLTLASIVLGHKGGQVRVEQLQSQMKGIMSPPNAD